MAIANATEKTKALGITRFNMSGKRWFETSGGNTYHSVALSALVGDAWVHLGKVDYAYGYDEQYAETGINWLIENGYLEKTPNHANGISTIYGWRYREANCVDTDVRDVNRKRDL
ncbi:hypothetical protein D3C80_1398590 [compost metagenome]